MHVPLGDTYSLKFTTRRFTTGAPFTLAGTPAISVYEEGNTTEITAGITLTADYDSRTGLNDVQIVASSGNGYEVGKYYDVVITTGTVDSVSVVGEVVGHFRVMAAEVSAGVPDANIASITAGAITAAAIASNAITAAKIAADAIGASELAADAVTAIQSGLALAAELAKVPKSDGTSSWNATALAAINAEADTALSDYDPPTSAELTIAINALLAVLGTPAGADLAADIAANLAAIVGLNDPDAAAIASAVLSAAAASPIAADIQEVDGAAISQGGSAPASPYGET